MRNLKRALSLALATIMVMSMMVVGAGAASLNDFSDNEKIANKEAVTVLTTLNVINGKDDGTYDPEGIVTRAEMAKMICVILNGGKDPQLGQTLKNSYTDTVGHWAAPYIEYCTTLAIVSGRGNGTFDPNGTVTVAEAGKMVLVALGYNAGVEGYTGANWQINTDVRANQKGLYDGLGTLNTNVDLTRDNAAQMLYNALDVNMVEYSYVITGTSDNSISTKPQLNDNKLGTLLYEKFNAVKVEGVVIGNQTALLTANVTDKEKDTKGGVIGSSLDANKTRISITNDDDQKAYAGIENFNVASDLDVLGCSVYLYVKVASSANKADVIGNVIVSVDNKIVTDYSGDSIKDVADDNSLDIVSTTKVVENYAAQAVLSDELAKKAGTTGVEKVLIDTDDDGDLDYVLLNTVELGKVTKYSTSSDGSITVSRAGGKSFTADDKDDVVGFENVVRDDVVLTAYVGGKLYVEKAESVTGTVEAYKLKNTSKIDYVGNATGTYTGNLTVDGTDYTVSFAPTYTDSADFFAAKDPADKGIIDSEATFYLDGQGYIIARTEVDEAAYQYAYVWGAEAGGSISTDQVKVTLDDGTTKTYYLDSKSDIDVISGDTSGYNINEYDMQGLIFAYSMNKNSEIKLMLPKGGAVEQANPDHTKGMTAIKFTSNAVKVPELTSANLRDSNTTNGETPEVKTYYANNSTVFFYVTMKNNNVDKVTVYTGRNSAPSVDGKQGEALMALNTKYDVGAVAMTDTSAKEEAGDHLFVYANKYVHSDYVQVGAILNGETEGKDIQVSKYLGSDVTNNTVVADGLYLFTKDGDQYELTAPAASSTFYKTGTVARTPIKNTLVLGDNDEYMITNKSVIIDNTTGPNPAEGILGGAINKGDKVWMLINSDNEILMAYFVTPEDVVDPGHSAYAPTYSIAGNTITVSKYGNDSMPSNQEIVAAVKEKLNNVSAVKVYVNAGNTYVDVTFAGGDVYTYDVTAANLYRVTYNNGDKFLKAGETLTVTDAAKTTLIRATTAATDPVVYGTVTGVHTGTKYTVNASDAINTWDIVLADGYKVTDRTSLTVETTKVTPAAGVYVPAGTELVIKAVPNGQSIVVKNGTTTVTTLNNDSGAAKDLTYKMPAQDVELTQITTPKSDLTVTMAADTEATLTDGVYTTKDLLAGFKVKVSAAKANQGDKVIVTVSPASILNSDYTLTVAAGGGETVVPGAGVAFSAGDGTSVEKQFEVTMGTADVTLTLSDSSDPRYKLTVPAGVTAAGTNTTLLSGNVYAVKNGESVTLTGLSGKYYTTDQSDSSKFAAKAAGLTMPAADTEVYDGYYKVAGTGLLNVTTAAVVGSSGTTVGKYTTATTGGVKLDDDNYYVLPGDTLKITFTWASEKVTPGADTITVTAANSTVSGTAVFPVDTETTTSKTVELTAFTDDVTVTLAGANA